MDNDDEDDVAVDFSNAVLYVGAFQTMLATVLTSIVSIASCSLLPQEAVSAVRTLVLSSVAGVFVVRHPFRIGRVHGLTLIFRALQPCVGFYVASTVAEQLVHTCTRDLSAPSWRRLVFHSSSTLMLISGFLRAKKPLANTDLPFLITLLALLIVAMLPPPAIMLSGPLCAVPTLQASAERVVRAFVFSFLYSVFVYAAAPPVQSTQEVLVCVMRASAASIWVLAVHILLLPLAAVQAAYVIYIRVFSQEYQFDETERLLTSPRKEESGIPMHATIEVDTEMGALPESPAVASSSDVITPVFNTIGQRGLVDISGTGGAIAPKIVCAGLSPSEMAAIAARIEDERL